MAKNPRISGIDWQGLQKGDLVPHDQVKEFFHSIFPDKEWDDFSMVKVIEKLMKLKTLSNLMDLLIHTCQVLTSCVVLETLLPNGS